MAPLISGNTIRGNKATLEEGSDDPPPGNGGGIYAAGVADLAIAANFISGNMADTRGDGIFCQDLASAAIRSNWISDNDGDGVYCTTPFTDGILISNNTIIRHSSSLPGFAYPGICCNGTESAAEIINNIVAFNGFGIQMIDAVAPTIDHNCVFENPCDPPDLLMTNGIYVDPWLRGDDIHLSRNSPCIDAGTNWVVQSCDEDIDGQDRILEWDELIVDVGADEVYGDSSLGGILGLSIEVDLVVQEAGLTSRATATVFDPQTGRPVYDYEVCFSVSGGVIVADPPPEPPDETCDQSDDRGKASILVTRPTQGVATVTAEIQQPAGGTAAVSADIEFYVIPLDWPMFMHDPQHTGLIGYGYPFEDVTLVEQWQMPVPTAATERTVTFGAHHHPGYEGAGGPWIFKHPYIDSSPVVHEGLVIVGAWISGSYADGAGSRGDVRCFEAETGALLWTTSMRDGQAIGGVASTPCVATVEVDGQEKTRAYVGSVDGYLYCLAVGDGSVVWAEFTTNRNEEASKIIAAPVVYNNVVYVGNEAAMMYAFEADDGDLVEEYPVVIPEDDLDHIRDHNGAYADPNMVGCSSPAVARTSECDFLVFGCDNEYLYSISIPGQPALVRDGRPDKEPDQGPGYCLESSPTIIVDPNGYACGVLIGQSQFWGDSLLRFAINSSGGLQLQDAVGLGRYVQIIPMGAFQGLFVILYG